MHTKQTTQIAQVIGFLILLVALGACSPKNGNSSPPTAQKDTLPVLEPPLEAPSLILPPETEKRLIETLPYLGKADLFAWPPDEMYDRCNADFPDAMSLEGFVSEAGQDEFYRLLAHLYQKQIDSIETLSQIKSLLETGFHRINASFRCISEGGTMYYHQSERIPARVLFALYQGHKSDFQTKQETLIGTVSDRIAEIALGYEEGFSEEKVYACIDPLEEPGGPHSIWALQQWLDYCEIYR